MFNTLGKTTTISLISASLLIPMGVAHAQGASSDVNIERMQAQINALQAQVESLKAQQDDTGNDVADLETQAATHSRPSDQLVATMTQARPTLYGQVGGRMIDQDGRDNQVQAYDARLGVRGMGRYADITALYNLEIGYTSPLQEDQSSLDDELIIRDARLAFPTQYGIFVIAPKSLSSQFTSLYGAVDIFETNRAYADNGVSRIFDQREISSNALSWLSPERLGLQTQFSYLTGRSDTGSDAEHLVWRLQWSAPEESVLNGMRAAVGQVYLDQRAVHAFAEEDAVRSAASIGFERNGLHIGATYEQSDFKGFANLDRENYGAVASYTNQGYTLGAGYFERRFDDDSRSSENNHGTVVTLQKQVDDNLMFFIEHGDFDIEGQSSLSAGTRLEF